MDKMSLKLQSFLVKERSYTAVEKCTGWMGPIVYERYTLSWSCNHTAVVMVSAEGLVLHHDSNLLTSNSGHITISKDWAKSVLHRMGYVKRRVSTSAKVLPKDFDAHKAPIILQYL